MASGRPLPVRGRQAGAAPEPARSGRDRLPAAGPADCLAQPTVVRELYAARRRGAEGREDDLAGPAAATRPQDDPADARCRRWSCSSAFSGGCAQIADEHAGESSAPRASRDSSRCSPRSSTRTTSREVEQPPEGAQVQGRDADQRPAGRGKQGQALHAPTAREQGWLGRLFDRSGYSFTIPDRDDERLQGAGRARGQRRQPRRQRARAVGRPRARASSRCCGCELGFYVGCLNLHERLAEHGRADALPVPVARGRAALCGPGVCTTCAWR